jgi:hypothetical protein
MILSPANGPITGISETAFHNPELIRIAQTEIPHSGVLLQTENGYTYLKVSDDFIHRLHPLIKETSIVKPDYFSEGTATGAHISVVYQNEIERPVCTNDIGKRFKFSINDLWYLRLGAKRYIALSVSSPELSSLRVAYGLSTDLNFRGIRVNFHLTVGVGESVKFNLQEQNRRREGLKD